MTAIVSRPTGDCMALKGLRTVMLAGTGLVCGALLIPSVRQVVEKAPRRWLAHHGVSAASLGTPGGFRFAAMRPDIRTTAPQWKSTLRADPLKPSPINTLADAMTSAEAQGSSVLRIGGHGSNVGLARPGPFAGPSQPGTPTETGAPTGPSIAEKDAEAPLLRQAVEAYRRNDVAAGDAAAHGLTSPTARLTAEWVAVKLDSHLVGLPRLEAFAQTHPDWPALAWVNRRVEEAVAATRDPAQIEARLGPAPKTVAARLALAQAERGLGHPEVAAKLVHALWRDEDLSVWQEATLAHDFSDVIDREDHRLRAEKFLYKEKLAAGMKEAALAGPDVVILAKARAAVVNNANGAEAALAAVPKALQADPLVVFSRVQRLRRLGKAEEAADLILSAPRDASIVDGDEWWTERRIVLRKLLDLGDPRKALRLCDDIGTEAGTASRIEAAFHAGWIALRFLQEPKTAAPQFDTIARLAETPISKSRAAYWQGRTAEAMSDTESAQRHFQDAAQYSITFYGQLAAARLGQDALALHTVAPATGDARSDAVKVADYLYSLGERDIALPLALDIGKSEPSDAQVGALGEVLERTRDARATLMIGKAATQRGLALDDTAFPTFGIPSFNPLPNSADLSVVYAIARQESEFDPRSLSSAGAKGLMQMISSTARSTASRAGVAYDDGRLSSDPAFNAQLGAAHLGTLLDEQQGSFILTFAAYNAGGKAVHDWIAAYGDPRKPGIDMVDWIERIPYSETRNYVQRVMENVQVYRAKLGRTPMLLVGAEPPPQARKGT